MSNFVAVVALIVKTNQPRLNANANGNELYLDSVFLDCFALQ